MEKKLVKGISYLKFEGRSASGPILLVLPGIGALKENYIKFTEALGDIYSKGLVIDLPQQGSEGLWRLGNMAELVDGVIKLEKTGKPLVIAGHSTGAAATLSHHFYLDSEVESFVISKAKIIEEILAASGPDLIGSHVQFRKELQDKMIASRSRQTQRADKIILCAPPYDFSSVSPPFITRYLQEWSSESLAVIMNILTNIPFSIMSNFTQMLFEPPKIKMFDVNFYGLDIENPSEFIQYILQAIHPMIILQLLNKLHMPIAQESREVKKLHVFGTLDWLVRAYTKWYPEKFATLENYLPLPIKGAGHLLLDNAILNVNTNTQLLRSEQLLEAARSFIIEE